MERFVVRRAALEDAAALCALHKASVRGLCAGAYSAQQIEAWVGHRVPEGFRWAMTDGGETMFVAERGGCLAGFASTKGDTLMGLYVDPDRGRGAGRLLLRTVEDHARCHGVAVLSLQATLTAVPFYRRLGYSADRPTVVLRGGVKLPVVEMSKML
jgi:putative acetyltransferase